MLTSHFVSFFTKCSPRYPYTLEHHLYVPRHCIFPATTLRLYSSDLKPIESYCIMFPFDMSPFCNVPASYVAFEHGGHVSLAVQRQIRSRMLLRRPINVNT